MLDSYLTHIVFISTFCLSKKWSKKDSPSEAPATAPANPNVPTCRALPIFHAEPAKSQPFSKKSVGALVAQGQPWAHSARAAEGRPPFIFCAKLAASAR